MSVHFRLLEPALSNRMFMGSTRVWCTEAASLPRQPHVVPLEDDRLVADVVFVGEHAHAGGPAIEKLPGDRRQPEPAGRDHADDVAAGEGEDVAREVTDAGDEVIGAGS